MMHTGNSTSNTSQLTPQGSPYSLQVRTHLPVGFLSTCGCPQCLQFLQCCLLVVTAFPLQFDYTSPVFAAAIHWTMSRSLLHTQGSSHKRFQPGVFSRGRGGWGWGSGLNYNSTSGLCRLLEITSEAYAVITILHFSGGALYVVSYVTRLREDSWLFTWDRCRILIQALLVRIIIVCI